MKRQGKKALRIMPNSIRKRPGKGSKHGVCATPSCEVRGACSPSKSSNMALYYCESCASAINDKCLSNGELPDVVVRPNSFGK